MRRSGGVRAGPRPVPPPAPQLGPGAARGPPSQLAEPRRGSAWGHAPRGAPAERRRQAPEVSTLPSLSAAVPRGEQAGRGAQRQRGGGVASSARKGPPPQSGGRGLLINSASARAPVPRPAVKSEGPSAEAEQPESGPGPERARATALRAAAGRRIMHTG